MSRAFLKRNNTADMMNKEELIQVGDTYLEALRTGNYESVPFSSEILFESPVAGVFNGIEETLGFLKPVSEGVLGIEKGDYFVADNKFFLTFKMKVVTPDGGETELLVADYIVMEDGKIAHIRPHFFANPFA